MAATAYDNFSVNFSRDGGTVVVHVAGELDVATAPQLADALVGVIDDQGSLFVRVDLRGVTFIDSTGLSLLVDALQRVRDKGGTLTLSHPAPSVRRVFGIVGFPRLFDITPERNGSAPSAGTAPAVGTVARRDHRSSSGTDAV